MSRRELLNGGLALGLALVAPRARACEFDALYLRVVHPWTRVAAVDDAYAIVGMRFEEVASTDRLVGIETPVATRAVMVSGATEGPLNILIPAGRETVLGETGDQVRLLGLRQPLELGRTYPLRLIFERSGTVDSELTVDLERD